MSYIFGSGSKKVTQTAHISIEELYDKPPNQFVAFGNGRYHLRQANINLQNLVSSYSENYRNESKKLRVVETVINEFLEKYPDSGFVCKVNSGPHKGKWIREQSLEVLLPKVRQMFRNPKPDEIPVTKKKTKPNLSSNSICEKSTDEKSIVEYTRDSIQHLIDGSSIPTDHCIPFDSNTIKNIITSLQKINHESQLIYRLIKEN